jgi:hypothetical protein
MQLHSIKSTGISPLGSTDLVILVSGSNPAWGRMLFCYFAVTSRDPQTATSAGSIVTKTSLDFRRKQPYVNTSCTIKIIIIIIIKINSYLLRAKEPRSKLQS